MPGSEITISTDPALLDIPVIHAFLTRSYWSPGIPLATVERALSNSLCFGVYDGSTPRHTVSRLPSQIGFARLITDRATYAYLADVFILEPHRGKGLSKLLVRTILAHPELQGLRRICLMTRDAQGLYARFGFKNTADPTRFMEIRNPDVYQHAAPTEPKPD